MGSVKDLIRDDSPAGKLYLPPKANAFGYGAWRVSGRFSVGDLKDQIPDSVIANKAAALTMINARWFEWLANRHPDIPTCYAGVMDSRGMVVNTETLLDRGETSNIIVMKLAHVPETFCGGNLEKYRAALQSGELQCGVADVESIFRHGFPLGSSTFKRIFGAVDKLDEYARLATYDETAAALDGIRALVADWGLSEFPDLEKVLAESGLGTTIPNPGHVLDGIVYDSTTKFEGTGDREITAEVAKLFSGLDDAGYELWTQQMFPDLARAQIEFCEQFGILNIDGKGECVAYLKRPVVTDFMCTPDENRLMLEVDGPGGKWAIPSNKEIQRAIFRQAGIFAAIDTAKERAVAAGQADTWKTYMPAVLGEADIDIREVSEHSCRLMGSAVSEVANRMLGKTVFETKPLDSWVGEFMPYASRIQR